MAMRCAEVEERLSDHYEGTLDEPVRVEVEKHLASCPSCSALRLALAEIVEALQSVPTLEPPIELAERVARASFAPPRRMPAWFQLLAAALAVAITGGVLWLLPEDRGLGRLRSGAVNAGVQLLERGERVVEDLRLIGVIVGAAFEGDMAKVSDRVQDYRRLLEKRRAAEPEDGKKPPNSSEPGASAPRLPDRTAWKDA